MPRSYRLFGDGHFAIGLSFSCCIPDLPTLSLGNWKCLQHPTCTQERVLDFTVPVVQLSRAELLYLVHLGAVFVLDPTVWGEGESALYFCTRSFF